MKPFDNQHLTGLPLDLLEFCAASEDQLCLADRYDERAAVKALRDALEADRRDEHLSAGEIFAIVEQLGAAIQVLADLAALGDEDVEDLREEVEDLRRKNRDLEGEVASWEAECYRLNDQVDALEAGD